MRAAVVGDPIAHSLSPVLHLAGYASLGLDWDYQRCQVPQGELEGFLSGLDDSWAGLSVTMPHKAAALAVADSVDPLAQAVGVANTLVRHSSGHLTAFNTDVAGIAAALREVAPDGWQPRRSVILGNRATACSALAALGELGCTSHSVIARRHGGPGSTTLVSHALGVEHRPLLWRHDDFTAAALREADVVISTVPAGAADPLAQFVASNAPAHALLLDVVYHPWPSPLTAAWQESGKIAAPGWLMLLHQAVDQVRLFTGHQPDVDAMRAALARALG